MASQELEEFSDAIAVPCHDDEKSQEQMLGYPSRVKYLAVTPKPPPPIPRLWHQKIQSETVPSEEQYKKRTHIGADRDIQYPPPKR